MLPFSSDQFFHVFATYNLAIWPMQLVALVFGALVTAALWTPARTHQRIAVGLLALLWGWTGVAYHIVFFAKINGAAVVFGAIFIVQASLFLLYAVRDSRLQFEYDSPARLWGWTLIGYSVGLYPLIGIWSGHTYPGAPMFGVTPCPLVIFTFGVLLFTRQRTPWALFVIPVLWSLIGGTAAVALDAYQDWGLPLSAVVAVIANARKRSETAVSDNSLSRQH